MKNIVAIVSFALLAFAGVGTTVEAGGAPAGYQYCNVQPDAAHCPTVNLNLNKTTFTEGEDITISWSATNADRCHIYPTHSSAISGTKVISAKKWMRYVVAQCYNKVGNKTYYTRKLQRINVNGQPAPVVSFTANGNSNTQLWIDAGDSVTLRWSARGADKCESSWTGPNVSLPLSGTKTFTPKSVTSYHLTCKKGTSRTQKYITVLVKQVPAPTVTSFNVSKQFITKGDSVTLAWSSKNASACTGSWTSASLPASGSATVTPNNLGTTFYYLNCTNSGTVKATASVAVVASAPKPKQDNSVKIRSLQNTKAAYERVRDFWKNHSGPQSFIDMYQKKIDEIQAQIDALM